MKKLIALILSLSFALSLTACELAEDIKYGRNDGMYSSQPDGGNSATDDLKDGTSSIIDGASSLIDGAADLVDGTKITADEAKQTALRDAGVKESDVTGLKAELDRDGNTLKYEVEFHHGGTEYDYDVDANTGKILTKSTDQD